MQLVVGCRLYHRRACWLTRSLPYFLAHSLTRSLPCGLAGLLVPGNWPRCLDAGLLLKNWSCPDTFKFEVRKHFPDLKTAPQVKYPPKASADDVWRRGREEGESLSIIDSDQT